MLTGKVYYSLYSVNPMEKDVSIARKIVIDDNNEEIAQGNTIKNFIPGDLEGVKLFMGSQDAAEIMFLSLLWRDLPQN